MRLLAGEQPLPWHIGWLCSPGRINQEPGERRIAQAEAEHEAVLTSCWARGSRCVLLTHVMTLVLMPFPII